MSEFTSAYLIHSIPYKETSVIAKVYTEKFGKISIIAKGVRRKKHKWRAFFTIFSPMNIDIKLSNKADGLAQLYNVEQNGKVKLHNDYLITLSLFYINELIQFLVPMGQPDINLFFTYQKILQDITLNDLELNLRLFEFNLIESLGYGLHFEYDSMHEELIAQELYYIKPLALPEKALIGKNSARNLFSGEILLCLSTVVIGEYTQEMLKAIKYILRLNINFLLEGRTLKSRELAKEYIEMKLANKKS